VAKVAAVIVAEILLTGNIRVTVLGVKGNQVRLGITAPSSVHVLRGELRGECPEEAGTTTMGCPALPRAAAP
jgi:carbon storage regulator